MAAMPRLAAATVRFAAASVAGSLVGRASKSQATLCGEPGCEGAALGYGGYLFPLTILEKIGPPFMPTFISSC
jgi:hypothetical protein